MGDALNQAVIYLAGIAEQQNAVLNQAAANTAAAREATAAATANANAITAIANQLAQNQVNRQRDEAGKAAAHLKPPTYDGSLESGRSWQSYDLDYEKMQRSDEWRL